MEAVDLQQQLSELRRQLERTIDELGGERLRAGNMEFMLAQQSAWGQQASVELARLNALLIASEQTTMALRERLAASSTELDMCKAIANSDTARLLAKWGHFSGLRVPMFLDQNARMAFAAEPTRHEARVAVVSVPKAGTYMIGAFLEAIGYVDCGIHAALWGFNDRRLLGPDPRIDAIPKFNVALPLAEYIGCVRPGEFVLSHIPPTPEALRHLHDFKVVFCVRNPRDCFVSFMRFAVRVEGPQSVFASLPDGPQRMATWARAQGRTFFDLALPVAGWEGRADQLTIRYEDLTSNGTAAAAAAARLIEYVAPGASFPDLERLLATPTLTWSGDPTHWQRWWSPHVEEIYTDLGGRELAGALAYDERTS